VEITLVSNEMNGLIRSFNSFRKFVICVLVSEVSGGLFWVGGWFWVAWVYVWKSVGWLGEVSVGGWLSFALLALNLRLCRL